MKVRLLEIFPVGKEEEYPFDLWWDTYVARDGYGSEKRFGPFKDKMKQIVVDAIDSGLEGDKLRFEILHGWHELLGGHAAGFKGLEYIMNAIEGRPLPDIRASKQGGVFYK